jgi:hypothetical protein
MNDNNIIKLDMCYILDGQFTDINCLYNLFIVHNKKELKNVKDEESENNSKTLKEEIQYLEKDGEYYKAMKRYFSLSIIEGKMNKNILQILNSDVGMFYKFISFLKLVVDMIDQKFKPISMDIIKSNLEYIKQFASHIVNLKVETYLNKLVDIIELNNEKKMSIEMNKLIDLSSKYINRIVGQMHFS